MEQKTEKIQDQDVFSEEQLQELIKLMQSSPKFKSHHIHELRGLIHEANPKAASQKAIQDKVHSAARVSDTEALLIEWARWCRVGDPSRLLRYPSISTFARLAGYGSLPTPLITEEEAAAVNKAMAKLKVRHPQTAKATMMYVFMAKPSHREISKRMKVSRIKAQMWVEIGINLMDEYLERG